MKAAPSAGVEDRSDTETSALARAAWAQPAPSTAARSGTPSPASLLLLPGGEKEDSSSPCPPLKFPSSPVAAPKSYRGSAAGVARGGARPAPPPRPPSSSPRGCTRVRRRSVAQRGCGAARHRGKRSMRRLGPLWPSPLPLPRHQHCGVGRGPRRPRASRCRGRRGREPRRGVEEAPRRRRSWFQGHRWCRRLAQSAARVRA